MGAATAVFVPLILAKPVQEVPSSRIPHDCSCLPTCCGGRLSVSAMLPLGRPDGYSPHARDRLALLDCGSAATLAIVVTLGTNGASEERDVYVADSIGPELPDGV